VREVHLSLAARGRLEANDGIRQWLRPNQLYVDFELCEATRISGGADLLEEPDGRELRERLQPGPNVLPVGIELAGLLPARSVSGRLREVAVELAASEPAIDRAAAEAQLTGDGPLTEALLEIMLQSHASLPFDHGHLPD
jgi:hypothetical protein